MKRFMVVLVLLAAGCDTSTVAGQAVGTPPPSTSPSSTVPSNTSPSSAKPEPTTPAPAQPPAPDLGECFDGDCEITVSEAVDVPVDPALGLETLSVEMTGPETVQFQMSGPGTSGGGSVSGGGDLQLNDLLIHVVAFTDNAVTLELSRVD